MGVLLNEPKIPPKVLHAPSSMSDVEGNSSQMCGACSPLIYDSTSRSLTVILKIFQSILIFLFYYLMRLHGFWLPFLPQMPQTHIICSVGFFKSSMKAIKAPAFLTTTIFILWSGSLLIKMSSRILNRNLICWGYCYKCST